MAGKLEFYYNNILRGADNAFSDRREKLPSTPKSIYEIIRPDSNKRKRLFAFLSVLRKALPDDAWKKFGVITAFRDFSHFPFDLDKYELKYRVGSGCQCDCFLFEPKDKNEHETFALKIFQNAGNSLSEVEEKAKQVNQDYAILSDWYKEMENLIPTQTSVISEHFQLPRGRPVLFVLQKFLGLDIKDLVEDFSEEEWNEFCKINPAIKEQLKQFAVITRNNIEKYGKVPDLLGKSNLSIVDSNTNPHLVFLDPDGIDKIDDMAEKVRNKVEARLELLYKRAGIK